MVTFRISGFYCKIGFACRVEVQELVMQVPCGPVDSACRSLSRMSKLGLFWRLHFQAEICAPHDTGHHSRPPGPMKQMLKIRELRVLVGMPVEGL